MQQDEQCLLELLEVGFEQGMASNQDEIMARVDALEHGLKGSPYHSFRPVALDSHSQTSTSGNPDTNFVSLVFMNNQHDKRVGK